jgi:hypothetical protein
MIKTTRRADAPKARSSRRHAVEHREDRHLAIALFERWQQSPWRPYARGKVRRRGA